MASANGVSNTIANLADVSEFQDGIIQKTLQEAQIQRQHAWAINNTIQTLVLGLSPSEWPRFATQALTLVPSKGPLPDQDALKQTYDFACASNTHATSQLVGSLLVGPGSESDEYADVGFWCGEIDEANKEISILRSLSLGAWAEKGTMTKLDLAPLTALRKSEMWELCAALRDLIEFRVGRPDSDGRVIHIMAGKGSGGWCGLIGVGVWSDIEE